MSFKKFLNNQPPERIIQHKKGWSRCVVGDYVEEFLGGSRFEPINDVAILSMIGKRAYDILKMDGRYIVATTDSNGNEIIEYHTANSYGDLRKLI